MVDSIRGSESEGQRLRPDANGEGLGSHSDPFPGEAVPRPQASAPTLATIAASVAAAAVTVRLRRGHTASIPRPLVKQLLLKHLAEVEGLQLIDLLNTASVHFLDDRDREVELDEVAITWGEG